MRSLLKALACMVVLISIIVLSPATASAETYTFNNGEITFNLGDDWEVYTKDNIKNYQGVLDDEIYTFINSIFDNNSFNYELFSFPPSYDYYWVFCYSKHNEIANLSALSDNEILDMTSGVGSSITLEQGNANDIEYRLYKKNGYKYIVSDLNLSSDGYTQAGTQYTTGVGNAVYVFTFYSFDDTPLSSVQKNEIQGVIDNVEYALPPVKENSVVNQSTYGQKPRIWDSAIKGAIKGAISGGILAAIAIIVRNLSKKRSAKNAPPVATSDDKTESETEPLDTAQTDLENEKEDLVIAPSGIPSNIPTQTEPGETVAIVPPIAETETEPNTPVASEDTSKQFFDLPQDKAAETPAIVPPIAEIETEPDIPITTAHFCRKCGAAIDADAKFCRKCGTETVDIEKN